MRVTVEHSHTLSNALDALAKLDPPLRTLAVLCEQIKDRGLRSAIELFTTGPYANILGGNTDDLDSSHRLQVFEMRALMDLDPKVHLPVLLYLLQRIERGLDGSPTMIILDEAGLALLHPVFSARIREWALTLRKRNAGIVLAFQALSQLEANSSFSTLLQSCPSRFYLPNDNAISPTVRTVYEACGLNPRQIELIAKARRKMDYYFVNPDGARLCSLALTGPELAFYGTLPGLSLQETHKAMRTCIRTHSPHWQPQWLRLAGEPAAASELENLMETQA
jgi:type IV secretion system protein VirB4